MSNLLNASTTLLRIVTPEATRALGREPALARRLQRAAERAEDALTDALCTLGGERRGHLREAHGALREVRSCLEALRGGLREPSAGGDEAIALAMRLQGEVEARARSA